MAELKGGPLSLFISNDIPNVAIKKLTRFCFARTKLIIWICRLKLISNHLMIRVSSSNVWVLTIYRHHLPLLGYFGLKSSAYFRAYNTLWYIFVYFWHKNYMIWPRTLWTPWITPFSTFLPIGYIVDGFNSLPLTC